MSHGQNVALKQHRNIYSDKKGIVSSSCYQENLLISGGHRIFRYLGQWTRPVSNMGQLFTDPTRGEAYFFAN